MSPQTIDQAILTLATQRGPGKTACPSEVARALAPEDWRPLMEPIRQRARALATEGRIYITQAGTPVDPGEPFRGPIRLKIRSDTATDAGETTTDVD